MGTGASPGLHMLDGTQDMDGGVLTFLEIAHMVDATSLIGWGGVGMLTFLEVSHMVDLLFLGISMLVRCYVSSAIIHSASIPFSISLERTARGQAKNSAVSTFKKPVWEL